MKQNKNSKKPWPTKDAMSQIYEKKLWGSGHSKYYSGEGSHQADYVIPYINAVSSFLKSFNERLKVCDLGCGDFNIGKQLYKFTKKYIAIDIVPELINYNKENFKCDNLQFQCLDIAKKPLPNADCAILRQVLQHLSNHEINEISKKLQQYKYVILTEHLPHKNFVPNKDIISGQGIRLKKESGVNLECDPFLMKLKSKKVLNQVYLNQGQEVILTLLYQMY